MDIDWSHSEAVWESLQGSEMVFALYGFYPSLHDARALGIAFDCTNRKLEMHFLCEDSTPFRPGVVPIEWSLIKMTWEGIASVDFTFDSIGIRAMGFQRVDQQICTRFLFFNSEGSILSSSVRIDSAEAVEDGKYDWGASRVMIQ